MVDCASYDRNGKLCTWSGEGCPLESFRDRAQCEQLVLDMVVVEPASKKFNPRVIRANDLI